MMSTNPKSLALRGAIIAQGQIFLATVENLPLASYGDTPEEAENRLVRQFRIWAEECEEKGILEQALIDAGFPDVDDHTEIYLIFSDDDESEG